MIPFLTCVHFPLNFVRGQWHLVLNATHQLTTGGKKTSRNGEKYFVLRNENFQMPNARHQK